MQKEDEIEIKVESSTWKSMYNFVGGIQILLPFTLVVAFFSQINFYREQIVQEWADNAAGDQHD